MRFRKWHRRSSYKPSGTLKVQGVLDAVIRNRGWFGKFDERRIFNLWDSIAGEGMVQHSQPISLSRGILRVEVSHPVYAQELSLMKDHLMKKLTTQQKNQDFSGHKSSTSVKIIDIQFRFNPNFRKNNFGQKSTRSVVESNTGTPKKVIKSVSPEMADQIEDTVSVIEDAELRDTFRSLFLTQCSHEKSQNKN
ncbi:DUF721 domain-containing protein [Candidatus Poribacteria bacterium]|nr:DUF721 domain-containing protein [Candidatus Poribacteria bacterium]